MSFNLKVIFLLTFVCGTLASQELDVPIFHADCPRIDDVNNLVMLPGPDCSKYYRCFNAQAYLQQCPYNLHWSAATYRCDQPEIAQCQQFIAPLTITPSLPTVYPYNPYNQITAGPTYPTMYPYNPYNPIPAGPTFPTMFPFNPNNPIPVTPTFQTMYPGIPNNPEVTYQRHPNDCSLYYQCQAKQCPSNLYWNSYTQQCDYPQNVQCPFRPVFNLADGTPTQAV